jgi:hypothetical protein
MFAPVARFLGIAIVALVLASPAAAGDAAAGKHVFKLPVFLAQGLKIDKETPATADILKKAEVQCIDDACKKQVADCRKALPNCTLVPSAESVHESEVEHN